MAPSLKIGLGLAASLLVGWIHHGPLGNGEKMIDRLEAQARAAVARSEVAGVQVRLQRDPLARIATLSGPANDLQRDGLGSLKGITDYVREVDGIAEVRWADQAPRRQKGAG